VGFLAGRLEHADVSEIAVTLGEIEAVADDEFVRDFEADEIGFKRDLPVKEDTGFEKSAQDRR
jgi:hypothetical protein